MLKDANKGEFMNEQYPATYAAPYEPQRNRVTTFFRIFMALPLLIVGAFFAIAGFFTVIGAWFVILFTGRNSDGLWQYNAGLIRFFTRLQAYVLLQTDAYPPFNLGHEDDYEVRVDFAPKPEQQSRAKAFFRMILVFPAAIVQNIISQAVAGGFAFASWLTIVFRGYQPRELQQATGYGIGYGLRYGAYIGLETDVYPRVGTEGEGAGQAPAAAPPAPVDPAPTA